MPIQEHEPLSSEPGLMSADKRAWWAGAWEKRALKQPRMAVLQYAMNSTRRPTAPDETVAYGYVSLNKFHDRESLVVLKTIETLDVQFFDSFPRKSTTALDETFKKAIIGEACRAFYRHGLSAYGKPGLRKHSEPLDPENPLATL